MDIKMNRLKDGQTDIWSDGWTDRHTERKLKPLQRNYVRGNKPLSPLVQALKQGCSFSFIVTFYPQSPLDRTWVFRYTFLHTFNIYHSQNLSTQPRGELHCTALCCTVLHCTALCCTVLYCTVVCGYGLLFILTVFFYPQSLHST